MKYSVKNQNKLFDLINKLCRFRCLIFNELSKRFSCVTVTDCKIKIN